MKSSTARLVLPLLAGVLLASCSVVHGIQAQNTARRQLVDAYAGQPVSHITYMGVHPGLIAISKNQLVTWTDFTQAHAYVITVGKGCPDLYLRGGVLTSTGDQVWAHSDHVLAGEGCEVQKIQPVDWLRVQDELSRLPQSGRDALPAEAGVRGG
jgi:hypothetical protein